MGGIPRVREPKGTSSTSANAGPGWAAGAGGAQTDSGSAGDSVADSSWAVAWVTGSERGGGTGLGEASELDAPPEVGGNAEPAGAAGVDDGVDEAAPGAVAPLSGAAGAGGVPDAAVDEPPGAWVDGVLGA